MKAIAAPTRANRRVDAEHPPYTSWNQGMGEPWGCPNAHGEIPRLARRGNLAGNDNAKHFPASTNPTVELQAAAVRP
jgi:hypothetical protein